MKIYLRGSKVRVELNGIIKVFGLLEEAKGLTLQYLESPISVAAISQSCRSVKLSTSCEKKEKFEMNHE